MVMTVFRTVDSRQSAFTAFNENILLEKLKMGGDCQYLKNKADVCWSIKDVLILAYMQLSQQQVIELIVHDLKKAQSLGEKRKKMNGNLKQNKPEKIPLS